MQPIGRCHASVPGYFILFWFALLPAHGTACPRPCACYVKTEVHCTFRYLNAIPKQIQADVERINFGYNSLTKLTENDFTGLKKLELLMLHSNEIQIIHENAFQDLSALQVLKMSYNKVKTLHKNTFQGLKSVVRLHIDNNKLEFLPPESFYGLTTLRLVHLEGNQLRQLHADTFVTLRFIQIFKTSTIKHIYLSDNQLSSLPEEMFSYLNELEGLYLHGNPWSCDCDLQWLTKPGRQSKDFIKCKRDRSGTQCPVCSSPRKNQGKSLNEISSEDLTCVKPTIENIYKLKNVSIPEESSFTAISAKDFVAPMGSLILNMTDQSGNEANLACSVQRPTNIGQITLDRKEEYTIMRTTFSSFLVCNIDYDHIQKLWGILAMYSDSPMKLKRQLLLAKTPFISYKYKQVSSGEDVFTDINAEIQAETNWLMQDLVTLQLDRTITTLSMLHIRYLTDIYVTIPNSVEYPLTNGWAMIVKDNQTQTEHSAIIGGTVEMDCQVVGEPVPDVEWVLPDGSKVRAPYMSEEGRITITKNGKFILRAADSFDTGVYHCIATNYVDADVLTFRITVVSGDVEEEAVNGIELSVSHGDILHLPCGSYGVPDASVNWILPDHSILHETSKNKVIFSNGTLKIQGVTQRDRGHFRCLAANPYGLDMLTHKVLVRDRKINTVIKKIELDQSEDENDEGSGNQEIKENLHSATGKAIEHKRYPNRRIPIKSDGQHNTNVAAQRRNRINHRYRGHRRQFTQNTRRIDPQRWTEILQKTKQNSINSKTITEVMKTVKEENDIESVSGDAEQPSGEGFLPVNENFLIVTKKYSSTDMQGTRPIVSSSVTDSNNLKWSTDIISTAPTKTNMDEGYTEMPEVSTYITVSSQEPTISEPLTSGANPTTSNYDSEQPTTLSILNISAQAIFQSLLTTSDLDILPTDDTTNLVSQSIPLTKYGRLESDSNTFVTTIRSLTATPTSGVISPTTSSSYLHTETQEIITPSVTAPTNSHYTAKNDISNSVLLENGLQTTAWYDYNNNITTSSYLNSLSENVVTFPEQEIPYVSSSSSNIIINPTTSSYDSSVPQNIFMDQTTTSSYLNVTSSNVLSKPPPLEQTSVPPTSSNRETSIIPTALEVIEPPVMNLITNTPASHEQSLFNVNSHSKTPMSLPTITTQSDVLANIADIIKGYSPSKLQTTPDNLHSSTSKIHTTKIPHYSEARDDLEDQTIHSFDSSTKSSAKIFFPQTDIGSIYFHSTQKIISPGLSASPTTIIPPLTEIIKDVTSFVPTLRRYGRRRIPGRRRIVRPDRIPSGRIHQFKFGKLENVNDFTETTTAYTTASETGKFKQLLHSTIPSIANAPFTMEQNPITAPETIEKKKATMPMTTQIKDTVRTDKSTNNLITPSHSVTDNTLQLSNTDRSASKLKVGLTYTQVPRISIATTMPVVGKNEVLVFTSPKPTTKPTAVSKIIRRKIPWHRLIGNNQLIQREILKKLRKNSHPTYTITTPDPTSKLMVTKSPGSTTPSAQSTSGSLKTEINVPYTKEERTVRRNPSSSTVAVVNYLKSTALGISAKSSATVTHPTTARVEETTAYPKTITKESNGRLTAVYPTITSEKHRLISQTNAAVPATIQAPTSINFAVTKVQPTSSKVENSGSYPVSTIGVKSSKKVTLIPVTGYDSTTLTPKTSVAANNRHRFLKRKRPRKKNLFNSVHTHKSSTNINLSTTSPEDTATFSRIPSTPKDTITTITRAPITLSSPKSDIPVKTLAKSFFSNLTKNDNSSIQTSHTMHGIDTLTPPYLEPSNINDMATTVQTIKKYSPHEHSFIATYKTKAFSTYTTRPKASEHSPLSVTANVIKSVTLPAPTVSPKSTQPSSTGFGKESINTPKTTQRNVNTVGYARKPVQYNISSTIIQQTEKKVTSRKNGEITPNTVHSKPHILGGKAASFTVLANSDALIPCEATGDPIPSILWTKVASGTFVSRTRRGNRMEVFPNGTLSISSVSIQDRGQYLCVANNQYGSDRQLVTLSVITYPPSIIQGKSREITVHSGSTVSIKCQAEGRPFPTITWILANETIASEKSENNNKVFVQPDGTLIIKEITIYERGIYKCFATNLAGADTFTVKVQVIAAPPAILEDKRQTVLVLPGENVKLHCTAKGNPQPSVHWVAFDGTKVKPLHYVSAKLFLFSNGTLYIRNVAPSDSGNYECIATSSTGSERRVITLRVEQNDIAPKIIHASTISTEMNFGDTLMLNCSATGEPKPRIIWRLPSKAVIDQWHRLGSRIHVYPNGSLVVLSVNEKDAGEYLCVARNKLGDDLILMKVNINMKPAKIVQKQYLTKQVPFGKDFRVDCKASGSPIPEISWSLPDGTMINNVLQADDSGRRRRRYILFDNGTLYLNKVGMSEEGDYTCYAENTLGKDEMKVHISVVAAAPRIKINPKTKFQARAGSCTILNCQATGEPKPKIFWLLPSSDMIATSHDRYTLHENGSLSINQIKLLDAGEYMCVARNPAGDDTRLLKLDVLSTPPVINGLYTNKTIIKDSALKHSRKLIPCSAEGTFPLQIMWIMPDNIYLTAPYHGSRIMVHKNGTLEIRNVRPSDTAEFTCVARNDEGESMLVVQLEVHDVLRRPMFKNPFNERIIAKPGKMAILNCFADGHPLPEITWLLPNGTRFVNGQRFSKYYAGANGTFIIYSLTKDDAGKYRCAARNNVGYIEKLIILEVGQKPNILTHPRGTIKNIIGETLSLHCLSDGIPRPSVTWTIPNGYIIDRPHGHGKYSLLENGTLVIQETSIHDRGNYLCKAKNNAGEAAISVAVMIVAYPPRITNKPPHNIHTREGSPVHLNCMAIGIPKPEISWELPDLSILTTDSKGRPMGTELVEPQGALVVQNPRTSDSGMYRCIAKNLLGTDSSTTYLKVI
ncbi:immunoglobulin superfamily member 10 isoform X1 [Eleutherodactylus coqui]|uniref:immunoglobulin superfamily member 10 isoform X1 n=1 Tax=Eleutherodactylus coqui TaxID=57060 RepID=UPI0034632898